MGFSTATGQPKSKLPAQKTTLDAFFKSPSALSSKGKPKGGRARPGTGSGWTKDEPVELLSSDDEQHQPASKKVKVLQPKEDEDASDLSPRLDKGKGRASVDSPTVDERHPPVKSLAIPPRAVANPNSLASKINVLSTSAIAGQDAGPSTSFKLTKAPVYVPSSSPPPIVRPTAPLLPTLPSCRGFSPDWPDDVPDLLGDEEDEWRDDEQGSQLDPDEEDENMDEVLVEEEQAHEPRRAGGLGDDGEGDSEIECLEDEAESRASTSTHKPLSSIRHSLLPETKPAANAFSLLMAKKKPSVWEAVEDDRSIKRGGKVLARGERRKAPFFKVMTGMPVAVDAFRYGKVPGVTAYLLSHAHSDHYTRLSKAWNSGPIYCSQTTANLIIRNLGVESRWVHPLEYNKPTELPNTKGVVCTMIEANHCPGSALFLFEGKRTCNAGDSPYPAKGVGGSKEYRYLHCGDFRACPKIVLHPAIKRAPLDEVYLDTTYLNPQYCFPPQPIVIDSVSALVKTLVLGSSSTAAPAPTGLAGWVKRDEREESVREREEKARIKGSKTLIAVGTYSIGKERIVKGIAEALGSKIYADSRKRLLINDQVEDPKLHSLMTSNSAESQVHMISLHDINPEGLANHLGKFKDRYDRIIGFRPTGWTFGGAAGTTNTPDLQTLIERDHAASSAFDAKDIKPMRGSSDRVMMLGVPYSEHSSFTELTCFCLSIPGEPRMIPTVNVGSAKSREKMDVWIKRWATEKRKRQAMGLEVVEYRSLDYW